MENRQVYFLSAFLFVFLFQLLYNGSMYRTIGGLFMLRSRVSYCLAILFCAIFTLSLFLVPSALVANAMSDEWYPPTCEANFGDSAAILSSKTTVVYYNKGSARLSTTYTFSASTPTTLSCSLPVYCPLYDVESCGATLSLNGITATPTYGYSWGSLLGSATDSYSDILALRENLSDIDSTVPVHQFMVSASEEAEFSFSLQEDDRMIYELGRHSYTGATRLYEVKVSPNSPCYFIVFGNKPTVTASDLCSITYKELSLDEYLAETIVFVTELSNGVDATNLVTHWVNAFLSSDVKVREDSLYNDCSRHSYAFFDYSLEIPSGESTIVVEQSMAVGLNSQFNPRVYVGKFYSPAQSAPLSFSVVTEQYVVDSTLTLKNNSYNGDAVEAVTIAFCAVKDPSLVNGSTWHFPPWLIAVEVILGVIVVGLVTFMIVYFVRWKISSKGKK